MLDICHKILNISADDSLDILRIRNISPSSSRICGRDTLSLLSVLSRKFAADMLASLQRREVDLNETVDSVM